MFKEPASGLFEYWNLNCNIWSVRPVVDGEFYWLDGTILTPSDYFTYNTGLYYVYFTGGNLLSDRLVNPRRFICQYGIA